MASNSGPIRVIHFGLGPIGAAVVRQVANRKGFKVVGAVDVDPAKVGRDLLEPPFLQRVNPRARGAPSAFHVHRGQIGDCDLHLGAASTSNGF